MMDGVEHPVDQATAAHGNSSTGDVVSADIVPSVDQQQTTISNQQANELSESIKQTLAASNDFQKNLIEIQCSVSGTNTATVGASGNGIATPTSAFPDDQRLNSRPIKHRPTFTGDQIAMMETIFKHRQYLAPVERESVATAVGLTAQQVRVWFQNRRQKAKQCLSMKQHQQLMREELLHQQQLNTSSTDKSKPNESDNSSQATVDMLTKQPQQLQATSTQIDPQLIQLLFPTVAKNDGQQQQPNGNGDTLVPSSASNEEEEVANNGSNKETVSAAVRGGGGNGNGNIVPSLMVSSNGSITISPQTLLYLTPLLLGGGQSTTQTAINTTTNGEQNAQHSETVAHHIDSNPNTSSAQPINAVQLLQTLSAVTTPRNPLSASSSSSSSLCTSGNKELVTTLAPLTAQSPVPVEETLTNDNLKTPPTSAPASSGSISTGLLSSDVLQQILGQVSENKNKLGSTNTGNDTQSTPVSALPPALSLSLTSSAGRSSRKKRQVFSGQQISEMEKHFAQSPYIDNKGREELAKTIGLLPDQVKVWFQNRRTKQTRLQWRQTGKDFENVES